MYEYVDKSSMTVSYNGYKQYDALFTQILMKKNALYENSKSVAQKK